MTQDRVLTYRAVSDLRPDPRNPSRKHNRKQLDAIARSIESFGFNAPVLVDKYNKVIAGHGRLEAAKTLQIERIPVISLDDLSESQAKAYTLADNRLTERSNWDDRLLATHLKELSEIVCDFEIEDTGFESPEIDLLIQGLDNPDEESEADQFSVSPSPAVSKLGDLWYLGKHRIYCGNALNPATYDALLGDQKASVVFTDVPYNLKISSISGLGKTKHREFAMASGEMSEGQFAAFLSGALRQCKSHTVDGGLIYACIDWRHIAEMELASSANSLDFLNLCVWVKSNGGMGGFYRSQHELVFVLRNGSTSHRNNVQLGKFGRNRTNVWHYPGATSFPRRGHKDEWTLHPTVKPIRLVADAILDSTVAGEIVLDPFAGSGTTLLAAERTHREARVIELDPLYVDTSILRWQKLTGEQARDANGLSFCERQRLGTTP